MPTREAARRIYAGMAYDLERSNYKVLHPLGHGAYGVVAAAEDSSTGERYAIKKIMNAFHNATDAKRTLREIMLMRSFDHENILGLHEILAPETWEDFDDLQIATPLVDTDLHRIINSENVLTTEHIQFFMWQILRALKYLHSMDCIHRDLKPSNILVNATCELKLCDFGLARVQGMHQHCAFQLTPYVATRWYRAPEVMLGWTCYTSAMDIWAAGLILAELLGRKPLLTGEDFLDQIRKIVALLGTPTRADLHGIRSSKAMAFLKSLPKSSRIDWQRKFPDADPLALDLLDKLLEFNPDNRPTAEEALEHPFLATYHNPELETVANEKLDSHMFADLEQLEPALIKREVFDIMCSYHPERSVLLPPEPEAQTMEPAES